MQSEYLSDIILLFYDIIVSKIISCSIILQRTVCNLVLDILIKRVIFENGLKLDR